MHQLLSKLSYSKLLQKAWDLDQEALFSNDKQKQKKLWEKSILICKNLFRKLKKIYPDNVQILCKLALIYQHQRKFVLTKKYLDVAKGISKNDPIILFNYGNMYRTMNKPRLAISYYEKAAKNSDSEIFRNELERYKEILKK